VIEPMGEALPRKRHTKLAGTGEVRRALCTGRMLLPKDDITIRSAKAAPMPDMTLGRWLSGKRPG
jgi:hypothetical protein